VSDAECVAFLQWALPRLQLRWSGFRRVRRQVCKRLGRRLRALGLGNLTAYRTRLQADAAEWAALDALCRITISRFGRDHAVWTGLAEHVLPALAEGARARHEPVLRAWSAGCASGEEPYTLAILWQQVLAPRFPAVALRILATDADAHLLERARRACYGAGTLRELPPDWRAAAFQRRGARWCLREKLRAAVTTQCADLREAVPDGPFHLILCRNVAFTYFAEPLQQRILAELAARLVPGGVLVLGSHERLPAGEWGLAPHPAALHCWRKAA
jgi:chemotaxis protein methyltransferase CheR